MQYAVFETAKVGIIKDYVNTEHGQTKDEQIIF